MRIYRDCPGCKKQYTRVEMGRHVNGKPSPLCCECLRPDEVLDARMSFVSTSGLRVNLTTYLELAASGITVVVTKNGHPCAQIVATSVEYEPRATGPHRIWFPDDYLDDAKVVPDE